MQINKQILKNLDWKKLLLNNYRDLMLSEQQVMILLMTSFCIENGEKFVTPDILSLKMAMKFAEIDKLFTGLLDRGFISIKDDNDHPYTSLDTLITLLGDSFMESVANDNDEKLNKEKESLYTLFENKFGRPLSYIEVQTIAAWLQEGCSEDLITSALNTAISKRIKSIRYIDQIILEQRRSEETAKEGYSTISDSYPHDIEKSAKIASLDWTKQNDK